MAEEKKNQGNEAQKSEATEERQVCKISALFAKIGQLLSENEPNKEMVDEFVQQATGEDLQRLLILEAIARQLSRILLSERVDDCLRSAQEEGVSPMAAMQKLEKELGALGFEIAGMIGI